MAEHNTGIQNVSFETYNNSDTPKRLDLRYNLSKPILSDPEHYKVAVTRLKLPSQLLKTFYMSDNSKHYIKMDVTGSHSDMINNRSSSNNVLFPTFIDPIYHPKSVIEIHNRMLQKAFEEAMTLPSDLTTVSAQTLNLSASSSVQNDHIISSSLTRCSFIKFHFGSYTQASNTTVPITITLVHVGSGKEAIIFSGVASELIGKSSFVFAESGYLRFGNWKGASYDYQPHESFLELCNQSPNSTWRVKLQSTEHITSTLTYDLVIQETPDGYSNATPYLSANNNNTLVLSYEHHHQVKNTELYFSPMMATHFGFFDDLLFNPSTNEYRYIFPSQLLDENDLTSITQITQQPSSYSELSNITKIVIESNSILTEGELVVSDEVSNNILADFTVPTDSFNGGPLEFSITHNPYRKLRLKNPRELREVDLKVYAVYKNGHKEILEYPSNSDAYIRLTFFHDNDRTMIV